MAQNATTLAEFRKLGFRVIEGGKSGAIALLKTPGITEMFDVAHKNVMRDIRVFLESGGSNLSREFAEHCRPTTYKIRGKDEPCFELTKVGFATVAAKYDPELRFRLALAFDALERNDGYAGALVIQQINARIRELRSRASGHAELDFDAPLPELTECEREHDEKTAREIRQLGIDGIQARLDLGPTPHEQALDALSDEDDEQDTLARHQWVGTKQVIGRDELPVGQSAEKWHAWVRARENWFRLPLPIRQRWWHDTNYGQRSPSPEMIKAIIATALP